jgi:hypothetical protein
MAEVRLGFKQRKLFFQWYWKFENVCEVQSRWRREFATEPPIRLTIPRIRDKLRLPVVYYARRVQSTNDLGDMAHQRVGKFCCGVTAIHLSPKQSVWRCARETGISRASAHRIIKTDEWKYYVPGCYMQWLKAILNV